MKTSILAAAIIAGTLSASIVSAQEMSAPAGPALTICLQLTASNPANAGFACHDVVADTVVKGLPRKSGGHVLYNGPTLCFSGTVFEGGSGCSSGLGTS
jgi:hypothetical protein